MTRPSEPRTQMSQEAYWRRENWLLQCQLAETRHALEQVRSELERTLGSRSWKATRLLRETLDGLRALRRGSSAATAAPILRSVEHFAPFSGKRPDKPLLLVDVTELAIENLQGGIQHTVKGIVSEWLLSSTLPWQVVPVQLTREGFYVSASRDLAHLFPAFNDPFSGGQVELRAGDVFLGLDLLRDHASTFRIALANLRELGVRVEVVVYDLLPIDLAECVPERINRSFVEWLNVVGDLADGVVCISRTVAGRFARWLGGREGRSDGIEVSSFRLGVPSSIPAPMATHDSAGTSFLMVGTVEPRKGYVDAIDAFERMWQTQDGADLTLTIVGRYGWGLPELLERIERHPELGRRLRWLRKATDEDVHACYASADALLFCSYGEGFGLPIVEAAQHGLPMVLRDLPEFREVAGDGALFFEGEGADAVRAAVTQWLELKRQGHVPLPRADIAITWEESARQLLSAIRISSEGVNDMSGFEVR